MGSNLKAFVNSPAGQSVQYVYLNGKGDYMLVKKAGFDKVLTRDQILALPDEPKPLTDAEKLAALQTQHDALKEQQARLASQNGTLASENETLKAEIASLKAAVDNVITAAPAANATVVEVPATASDTPAATADKKVKKATNNQAAQAPSITANGTE